jgi:hypothetical protein
MFTSSAKNHPNIKCLRSYSAKRPLSKDEDPSKEAKKVKTKQTTDEEALTSLLYIMKLRTEERQQTAHEQLQLQQKADARQQANFERQVTMEERRLALAESQESREAAKEVHEERKACCEEYNTKVERAMKMAESNNEVVRKADENKLAELLAQDF